MVPSGAQPRGSAGFKDRRTSPTPRGSVFWGPQAAPAPAWCAAKDAAGENSGTEKNLSREGCEFRGHYT